MAKEMQKQTAEQERIDGKELLTELRLMMQDTFVGAIEEEQGEIVIRFLNGQKFKVAVRTA